MIEKITDLWINEIPLYAKIVYSVVLLAILLYTALVYRDPSFLFKSLKGTWSSIKEAFKQMNNIRGYISLIIAWIALSGAGLVFLGVITYNSNLAAIGFTMILIWSGPGTPLILVVIAFGMFLQRVILRDKSVKFSKIVNAFKEGFKGVIPKKEVKNK